MKLHNLTLTAIAAFMLAYNAKSADVVGTTTQFSKVNVALTVETNKPEVVAGNTLKDTTAKAKINNKVLLQMFADWTGNDWETNGAQLIFDWETYQLAVADKTGSNILFYAGNGVTNGTVQAFCTLDWFDDGGLFDFGAFTETRSTVNPGSDVWSLTSFGFFELSFDDSSNPG